MVAELLQTVEAREATPGRNLTRGEVMAAAEEPTDARIPDPPAAAKAVDLLRAQTVSKTGTNCNDLADRNV